MDNKAFLLACNHIPFLGPKTVQKLLKKWPDLSILFQYSHDQLEETGLSPSLCQAITTFDWRKVDDDFFWEKHEGNHILTLEDPNYPKLLKEIYDPPPVLYLRGNLDALKQNKVAMVGSRNPSITGSEIAHQFAKELSDHRLALVSGLALGIDAAVHEGSLAAEGETLAVMGTGIDRIYPRVHTKLADKITEKGLLISEFPLKTPPTSGHFPRRNRIISGLSLLTVVVEAAIKSGSLITARFAMEQNRDVLAIPGSIYNPQTRGCHYLVQQGAKLVSSVSDILQELGFDCPISENKLQSTLASHDKNLVKFLGFETTNIDTLCRRSGLTIEKVACSLAELEILGLIKTVPGGYMRCSE